MFSLDFWGSAYRPMIGSRCRSWTPHVAHQSWTPVETLRRQASHDLIRCGVVFIEKSICYMVARVYIGSYERLPLGEIVFTRLKCDVVPQTF